MDDVPGVPSIDFDEFWQNFADVFGNVGWATAGIVILYTAIGFILASFCSSITGKIFSRYTSEHYTQIIKRVVYYAILIVTAIFILTSLHLDVKVLGIATVLTLAIGFASQTAVSNIISGLFLVFEKPFLVGDHIVINEIRGELLSIDLLSIKVRTFQNALVRVPNEQLLKTNFINETRYPIRRLDTKIRIGLNEDVEKVKRILIDMANKNQLCLESPPPLFLFEEFSDSAIIMIFAVWVKQSSFLSFKHIIPFEIQKTFRENNIIIPGMQHVVQVTNSDPHNLHVIENKNFVESKT